MDHSDIPVRRVRALFLSDIHLGSRACRAEALLDFLRAYESERIYLIGDIVDFWAMSRALYWPPSHNTVVQKILRKARHGTRVTLIPGNHDEALLEYTGAAFGDVAVVESEVYTALDGRRYALLHGDRYDQVTHYARWASILGDISYNVLVHVNRLLSWVRRRLNVSGHWSLADYAKRNVLRAVSFIGDFERSVAYDVKRRRLDGVICGHIHTPTIKLVDGIVYLNCGDWVDNCTAIVEHLDGRMELVRWIQNTATCEVTLAHAEA